MRAYDADELLVRRRGTAVQNGVSNGIDGRVGQPDDPSKRAVLERMLVKEQVATRDDGQLADPLADRLVSGLASVWADGRRRDRDEGDLPERVPAQSGVAGYEALLRCPAEASPVPSDAADMESTAGQMRWLRQTVTHHLKQRGAGNEPALAQVKDLVSRIIEVLCSDMADEALQGTMLDLLGIEGIETAADILQKRPVMLVMVDALREQAISRLPQDRKTNRKPITQTPQFSIRSESDLRRMKQERKGRGTRPHLSSLEILEATGFDQQYLAEQTLGSARGGLKMLSQTLKAVGPPASARDAGRGAGLRMVLPEGTKRTQGFKYEEIDVPAPRKSEAPRGKLVPVGSLPEWAQMAFEGTTHLNTVQSIVFNKAFGSTSNLLVSAPTGAGKTNVAMLTILQAIEANRDAFGAVLSPKEFKMVYIAPMKALVAEVVEKFSSRLAPLGIEVKEMTGDMQLTRQELERVHLIVTVPEKFDILTRNTATGAGREDSSLMSKVALIIIDEVHLLNDDRGPVIESIVARAKRYMETSGAFIRLVAISATLPNWTDVAQFFHVPADHAFHFDSSYRPIPLQQTFIGVAEKDPQRRLHRMNELCYEKIKAAISSGHQAMVFVHSRGDTYTAAKALMEIASAKGDLERFLDHENRADIVRRIRSPQVLELVPSGFAMHHAGMLRSDRSNVERLFMTGCIKVLCCTATLAHGGFRDIDVLDILQVFGRAGRPQFDDLGHAVLITSHDKLDSYLMKINNQIPIESKMLDNMCNALNAEIAMNNIADINDAIDYLGYTYLFVRMARSPHVYGIKPEELLHDPHLIAKRRDIVTSAVKKLDANKLLRLSNQQLAPTAIGRIAARYYIDYETT
ncbi:unnamed protein product [Vitrella brassicaformis CCMP3155]|uniref:Helicase ATP-binding domain-containing protein n=2 Tax=Vitrella brassicaformis TaxID=1169539 RepID=A0A0G4F284_VITBC|nr:unnamed protein product [Vitrella brassicaformis CCMP3155]|eukprot:CEM05466.1 unnamed protein product [Vitrella brassicaformis CCMP3155]